MENVFLIMQIHKTLVKEIELLLDEEFKRINIELTDLTQVQLLFLIIFFLLQVIILEEKMKQIVLLILFNVE
jgi:hypothetical protein